MQFERLRARLDYELVEDQLTRGAQIVVERAGQRVLDLAVGESGVGTPLTSSTMFRVYCTIKPVTSIAIARLIDDGVVDLDEPLEDRLPDLPIVAGGVTARHVLTHTAGLESTRGSDLELVPFDRRRAWLRSTKRRPGWRIGRDTGYSEATGWYVLGWLIEAITGDCLRDHLRREILEPLDLSSTWIGMTAEEYAAAAPLLGVNIDTRDQVFMPLLYERSERVCCGTNPAYGGYTTASDLAAFYTALLAGVSERGHPSLPATPVLRQFCSQARPPTYDEVLDRTCPFGLGFMTSLADHAFGEDCSPSSFGHSGYVGSSFAFADPEHDMTVGVIFNGIVTHESAFLRRRAIIRALYADLVGEAVAEVSPESARRRRWFR